MYHNHKTYQQQLSNHMSHMSHTQSDSIEFEQHAYLPVQSTYNVEPPQNNMHTHMIQALQHERMERYQKEQRRSQLMQQTQERAMKRYREMVRSTKTKQDEDNINVDNEGEDFSGGRRSHKTNSETRKSALMLSPPHVKQSSIKLITPEMIARNKAAQKVFYSPPQGDAVSSPKTDQQSSASPAETDLVSQCDESKSTLKKEVIPVQKELNSVKSGPGSHRQAPTPLSHRKSRQHAIPSSVMSPLSPAVKKQTASLYEFMSATAMATSGNAVDHSQELEEPQSISGIPTPTPLSNVKPGNRWAKANDGSLVTQGGSISKQARFEEAVKMSPAKEEITRKEDDMGSHAFDTANDRQQEELDEADPYPKQNTNDDDYEKSDASFEDWAQPNNRTPAVILRTEAFTTPAPVTFKDFKSSTSSQMNPSEVRKLNFESPGEVSKRASLTKIRTTEPSESRPPTTPTTHTKASFMFTPSLMFSPTPLSPAPNPPALPTSLQGDDLAKNLSILDNIIHSLQALTQQQQKRLLEQTPKERGKNAGADEYAKVEVNAKQELQPPEDVELSTLYDVSEVSEEDLEEDDNDEGEYTCVRARGESSIDEAIPNILSPEKNLKTQSKTQNGKSMGESNELSSISSDLEADEDENNYQGSKNKNTYAQQLESQFNDALMESSNEVGCANFNGEKVGTLLTKGYILAFHADDTSSIATTQLADTHGIPSSSDEHMSIEQLSTSSKDSQPRMINVYDESDGDFDWVISEAMALFGGKESAVSRLLSQSAKKPESKAKLMNSSLSSPNKSVSNLRTRTPSSLLKESISHHRKGQDRQTTRSVSEMEDDFSLPKMIVQHSEENDGDKENECRHEEHSTLSQNKTDLSVQQGSEGLPLLSLPLNNRASNMSLNEALTSSPQQKTVKPRATPSNGVAQTASKFKETQHESDKHIHDQRAYFEHDSLQDLRHSARQPVADLPDMDRVRMLVRHHLARLKVTNSSIEVVQDAEEHIFGQNRTAWSTDEGNSSSKLVCNNDNNELFEVGTGYIYSDNEVGDGESYYEDEDSDYVKHIHFDGMQPNRDSEVFDALDGHDGSNQAQRGQRENNVELSTHGTNIHRIVSTGLSAQSGQVSRVPERATLKQQRATQKQPFLYSYKPLPITPEAEQVSLNRARKRAANFNPGRKVDPERDLAQRILRTYVSNGAKTSR